MDKGTNKGTISQKKRTDHAQCIMGIKTELIDSASPGRELYDHDSSRDKWNAGNEALTLTMSICDSLASTILCTNNCVSTNEEHASNVKFPGV